MRSGPILEQHATVKVDLGCGLSKEAGFLGVDRTQMPGVDVVADLDGALPFPDDAVGHVRASHSLEHVADLTHVMSEIFRICRDRSVVTIVAPYATTGLNVANPYHKQAFNEHTARFLTDAAETALPPADWDFPTAMHWGLAHSDHSNPAYDFRLLKCEFFYMPPYRRLNESEKRQLRKSLDDVVDELLIQLLVVKSPLNSVEWNDWLSKTDLPEPPNLVARRRAENSDSTSNVFTQLVALPHEVEMLTLKVDALSSAVQQTLSEQAHRITLVNAELIRRDTRNAELTRMLLERLVTLEDEESSRPPRARFTERKQRTSAENLWKVRKFTRLRQIYERSPRGLKAVGRALAFTQSRVDLLPILAPNFHHLGAWGVSQRLSENGYRLQQSSIWKEGGTHTFRVPTSSVAHGGIEVGLTADAPPTAAVPVLEAHVWSDGEGSTIRSQVIIDGGVRTSPVRVGLGSFVPRGPHMNVRLIALPAASEHGVRTLEWRKRTLWSVDRKLFCVWT